VRVRERDSGADGPVCYRSAVQLEVKNSSRNVSSKKENYRFCSMIFYTWSKFFRLLSRARDV